MKKTYNISNSKDFHGAPLNRTAPFPEKGSLFEFYGTWIKTEDLIRELVDTTADIIITALYDLSRELKDDIWKKTNLKFYIETLASTGYDRTLAWYIGFDSSHKVLLGNLHIIEQTLLIKKAGKSQKDRALFPFKKKSGTFSGKTLVKREIICYNITVSKN